MKKRILTMGVMLVLVWVLVLPGAVLGANTTEVTGTVTEGYTFSAPSAVSLGSMAPSATAYKANSQDGRLDGNNGLGYTVTGVDAKTTNKGCMVSGSDVLTNRLEISNADSSYIPADTAKTFLDTGGITGEDISLYVSQLVTYADPVATGYTITITFTVTTKT